MIVSFFYCVLVFSVTEPHLELKVEILISINKMDYKKREHFSNFVQQP